MGLGDLLGGAGGLIGGIIGDRQGGGDRRRSREEMERALAELQNLDPASLAELMGDAQTGPSAFESIREDPATRNAQMAALGDLRRTWETGGMDAADKAVLAEGLNAAKEQERSQRDAAVQQMAMRGMAGGGAELAARLSAQQGAANQANRGAVQAAGDARLRALSSLRDSAGLAGVIRVQDWQRDASRAQAQDAIARFNASQRMGAYDQAWGQQFGRAQAVAGAHEGIAGVYAGEAQRKARRGQAIGQGIGAAVGGGADAYLNWKGG